MNARIYINTRNSSEDKEQGVHVSSAVNANMIFSEIADQIAELQRIYNLSTGDFENNSSEKVHNWLLSTIRVRRLRNKYFSAQLFSDPAWDILLDLTIAKINGRKISVSSLCIAASVPTTTALRKIKEMLADGLIYKEPDIRDKRRSYIHICDHTYNKMLEFIGESYRPTKNQ